MKSANLHDSARRGATRAIALAACLIVVQTRSASAQTGAAAQAAPAATAPAVQDVAPAAADAIPTSFQINDEDPESTIPDAADAMKNPLQMGYLMMAFSDRAETALADGNPAKAAKYFRAMGKAVPDRAVSFRKACQAHLAAGQPEQALEMCRLALGKGGVTVADHVAFVQLMLKKPGSLTPQELEDLEAVVDRLGGEATIAEKDPSWPLRLAELKCQVATRIAQSARLTACVEELRKLKVDRAKALPYEWALAMSKSDLTEAQHILQEAEQAKLPASSLDVMKRGLSLAEQARATTAAQNAPSWWPGALVLALTLAALVAIKLRRTRLRPA